MKGYLVLPVVITLIAAMLAGCISPEQPGQVTATPTPVSKPRVNTPTVTPAATAVPTPPDIHEPIIGVWRYSDSSGLDDRYEFDSHFRYTESVYSPRAQRNQVIYGSWYPDSYKSYELSSTYQGIHTIMIYDREKDAIYDTKYPDALFYRYQGSVIQK